MIKFVAIKVWELYVWTLFVLLLGVFAGLTMFNDYDVNHDNEVNSSDLLELRKYLIEQ